MNTTKKYPAYQDAGKKQQKIKYIIAVATVLAILWAICVATLLIYSIVDNAPSKGDKPDGDGNGAIVETKTYTTSDFTYKVQLDDVAKNAINSTSIEYLALINKENPVGATYTVENLKNLDTDYTAGGKTLELESNAAIAAEALMAEMRAYGYSEIVITSAYRSYDYQKNLFDKYMAQERAKNPNLSDEQLKKIVLGYSAEPGYSEHHSGLVIDFYLPKRMIDLVNFGSETASSSADIGFAESQEYQWLLKNAHRFGFILRYPEDKVSETGYNYESWHFRFVGIDAATKIYENNTTLEAYLK